MRPFPFHPARGKNRLLGGVTFVTFAGAACHRVPRPRGSCFPVEQRGVEEVNKDADVSAELLNSPSALILATLKLFSKPPADFFSARCAGREPL